jgi:hypothetical protein
MKNIIIGFVLFLIFYKPALVYSQNVGINTTGATPAGNAILDLNTGNTFTSPNGLGLLLPNVSLTDSLDITTIPNPTGGMMIYNTGRQCLEYYSTGYGWVGIDCPCYHVPTGVTVLGNTTPNAGISYTYTCNVTATSYNWSVSSTNASITSGQGTQSATIIFNASTTMTVCVAANNSCGSASSCLTVNPVCHGSNTYNWNGATYTYYTGSVQTWTVPACVTTVTISISGGQGGGSIGGAKTFAGGDGAKLVGTATVTPGDVVDILVGGQGDDVDNNFGGGGGGASYVWDATTNALIAVAGGGGGGGATDAGAAGESSTVNAAALQTAVDGASNGADGNFITGTGGNLGGGTVAQGPGAGGSGWTGNGASSGSPPPTGGLRPATGGTGGTSFHYELDFGGYGGGGGGGKNGGGGGGGYAGGGGGTGAAGGVGHGGAGGGSYWQGGAVGNISSAVNTNTGNGQVTITY